MYNTESEKIVRTQIPMMSAKQVCTQGVKKTIA